jgi:hypothetical protein
MKSRREREMERERERSPVLDWGGVRAGEWESACLANEEVYARVNF